MDTKSLPNNSWDKFIVTKTNTIEVSAKDEEHALEVAEWEAAQYGWDYSSTEAEIVEP